MSDHDISTLECSLTDASESCNSPCSVKINEEPNYDELVLAKVLNQAKFPVLLGYLPSSNQQLAVKLFPYEANKPNRCFYNEIKFINLRHENICSTLHYEQERAASFEDCSSKISYTIMELAPYGDFCDLLLSQKLPLDDKLVRTFFHQLIEGLQYLHVAGVAHLDLKCDNLLLSDDFKLKICDFDQAYIKGQGAIYSSGTLGFRAPELVQKRCRNPEAADIYSAGIILFTLKCAGCLPYEEKQRTRQDVDMFNVMINHPEEFWRRHSELQEREMSFFDEDFRSLFLSMVAYKPNERINIEQIKESKWYNGPIYSQDELSALLKVRL